MNCDGLKLNSRTESDFKNDSPEEDSDDSKNCLKKEPSPNDSSPALSKRALKRLKKKEKWEATRGQRRAAERERRKKRAAEEREKRMENPDANGETFHQMRKRLKKNKMESSACKVTVAVDCNWEHLMEAKDIQKLAKQIQYSYTTNRRLTDPLQLFVTGLKDGTTLKAKLEKDYAGYVNWDMNLRAENFDECFDKEKIVYLTSESENVLDKLDHEKAYVIGGLVDHNQHKGICHETALSKDLVHARLPIEEFMEMKTRRVLTVNHVFDILAFASQSIDCDWKDAFVRAIPSRKGAIVKIEDREDDEEELENAFEEVEGEENVEEEEKSP